MDIITLGPLLVIADPSRLMLAYGMPNYAATIFVAHNANAYRKALNDIPGFIAYSETLFKRV